MPSLSCILASTNLLSFGVDWAKRNGGQFRTFRQRGILTSCWTRVSGSTLYSKENQISILPLSLFCSIFLFRLLSSLLAQQVTIVVGEKGRGWLFSPALLAEITNTCLATLSEGGTETKNSCFFSYCLGQLQCEWAEGQFLLLFLRSSLPRFFSPSRWRTLGESLQMLPVMMQTALAVTRSRSGAGWN